MGTRYTILPTTLFENFHNNFKGYLRKRLYFTVGPILRQHEIVIT